MGKCVIVFCRFVEKHHISCGILQYASHRSELLLLRFRGGICYDSWDRACFCTQCGPACGVLVGIASRVQQCTGSMRRFFSCFTPPKTVVRYCHWGLDARNAVGKTAEEFVGISFLWPDRGYRSRILWRRTLCLLLFIGYFSRLAAGWEFFALDRDFDENRKNPIFYVAD